MEIEFLDIDKRKAWNIIFHEIRNESNNFSHIINEAKKLENKNLNRYRDVNPYDHSRVRLERGERDYINASLVNVPSAGRSYILTQGPLPITTGHFWLMVWEQKSKAILMLNRVIEKNTIKCHQYWPIGIENAGNDDLLLTDVNMKVTFISQKNESYYIVRKFLLTDLEGQESREILQFHYTTWPDFGVPESPAAFLNFLFSVRDSGTLNSNVGPPVVHCSAGIGRSGTFCLVDSCLVLIEKNNNTNSINIRQQLLEMRHYRMGLIQTPDQLRFSYVAIIEGAKKILSNCPQNNLLAENENVRETCMNYTFNSKNSNFCMKEIESSDISPPLPPRSLHSSEDLLSIQNKSVINRENNAEVENCDSSVSTFMQLKVDALAPANVKCSSPNNLDSEEQKNICSETNKSSPEVPSNTPEKSELRKRARKEREEKTANMVKNIKKRQKETELWEKRRAQSNGSNRMKSGGRKEKEENKDNKGNGT